MIATPAARRCRSRRRRPASGVESGRERRSDGLLKHLGLLDTASFRVTDNLVAASLPGAGMELLYSKSLQTSYIQSIDRDAGVVRDLTISARNITLIPAAPGTLVLPAGSITTAAIAPGAVNQSLGSYFSTPGFSTTVINTWLATPISVQFTTAGGLLRIEASTPIYHNVSGAGFYVGFMLDGVIQNSLAYYNAPGPNWTVNFGMTWYIQPAAGIHTIALGVFNAAAGTLATNSAAYSSIYVTEQKR
jgi:hypothetical protein